MAQWIRVWPQRTLWWAEEVLFPHTGLTAVLNRLAAFVTQVVFSEKGQGVWEAGWGLRGVCVNSRKNTHIHNKAQRIRPRSHHQPTLENSFLPPSCRLGPSPPMPGHFGLSASLISTYAGEGKPVWRRGQAWAHPINPPPPNHPSRTPPFYPSISKPECINLPFMTAAINKGRSEPCVMGG